MNILIICETNFVTKNFHQHPSLYHVINKEGEPSNL